MNLDDTCTRQSIRVKLKQLLTARDYESVSLVMFTSGNFSRTAVSAALSMPQNTLAVPHEWEQHCHFLGLRDSTGAFFAKGATGEVRLFKAMCSRKAVNTRILHLHFPTSLFETSS